MTDNVILISYENEDTKEFRFYEMTAMRNGWNIIQKGKGEKWEGFTNKIKAYRRACDEYSDDTILIFTDARDVVCLRNKKGFQKAFEYMKSDIVVSAEVFCEGKLEVPDGYKGRQCVSLHSYYKYHDIKSHPIRKFVNSGLIAGRAKTAKHMWEWILEQGFTDDQYGLGMYMNTFPMNVRLDADAEILHTTTFGVNGGIYSIHQQKLDAPSYGELFGCGPYFLHIPGNRNFKGQKALYDIVKCHLEKHTSDELIRLYGSEIPGWDDYNDLVKK